MKPARTCCTRLVACDWRCYPASRLSVLPVNSWNRCRMASMERLYDRGCGHQRGVSAHLSGADGDYISVVSGGARGAVAGPFLSPGLAPGIVQRRSIRSAARRGGYSQSIPDEMKKPLLTLGRVVLTLLVVIFAAIVVWRMVMYYMYAPWTRDGHIRADVVQIAPDVSGLIQKVEVRDNEVVTKGQVLFTIDQDRFRLALRQAQATVSERKETYEQARRENKRNQGLGNLVAREQLEEGQSREARALSALSESQVAVDAAQLNLDRSVIRSPVDGYLNDRAPREQEFVTAGRPVLSVVDGSSFHIDGYFEETKLDGIHIGQSVDIRVIGDNARLRGHVVSIVAGIEDRDRSSGSNLLPNVNPAFSWVRLAQRIPVRIALDEVPADFRMIAGRTATVSVRDLAPLGKSNTAASADGASGGVAASGASAVAPVSAVGVSPVSGVGSGTATASAPGASAPGATPGASQ